MRRSRGKFTATILHNRYYKSPSRITGKNIEVISKIRRGESWKLSLEQIYFVIYNKFLDIAGLAVFIAVWIFR